MDTFGCVCVYVSGFSSCLCELVEHESEVRSVTFGQQSAVAASGSDDGSVILWDLRSQAYSWSSDVFSEEVTCVALSPDARSIGQPIPSIFLDHFNIGHYADS